MEEKLLIFREPTRTVIAYDFNYYKVNDAMIEKLVRRSMQYGQTIGCDLSRAQFGEIVCHTNPSTISKKMARRGHC